VLLAFLMGTLSASARIGVVQSRDGRLLRGHIRLSTNGVTVLNAETETAATIIPSNLADLYFEPQPQSGWVTYPRRSNSGLRWQAEDIGSQNSEGSIQMASGLFRVRSVGTNIAGNADSFHFVYRPSDGDCEIMARVVNVQPRYASKAGVMIREKLTADSVNVFFGLTESRGVVQHRDVNGGETEIDPTPQGGASTWLRLKRSGNQFLVSASHEGMHWVRYASMTVPMSEHVWIGLAASAGQQQIAGVATIDNVTQDIIVPHTSFTPQVHLQSGSVISGPILAGDDSEFSLASFPFSVPASTVSYLLFRWLPYRFSSQISGGTPGVLLTSGQFVQGSLSRLQREMLGLSSVLFGLQSIDTDSEAYALVLRRPSVEVPSRYMVVTENGSSFRARQLSFGDFEVSFVEDALGQCRLPMHELLWLRCAP